MKTVGIIPARYSSTRFPGKPLALILGTSLIQRTYDNAKKAKTLDELIVATDDSRIFEHVLSFGGQAVFTSPDCLTGSDRVAEAAKQYPEAQIIVNIQGDEPCIDPSTIDKAVLALQQDEEALVATAATPLTEEEAQLSSVVKCVLDARGRALYFSRALIPAGKENSFRPEIPYLRHIGLYVFRREFLFQYAQLSPTPLMLAEDLEQLKILEHGYKVHVVTVTGFSPGVDLPEDIQKVEKILCQNMCL